MHAYHRFLRHLGLTTILGLTLVAGSVVQAEVISAHKQFDLASSGQFDELARLLGAEPLDKLPKMADVHALCFAFGKIKKYDKLEPCLDEMQRRIKIGDKATRFFDLDDATPVMHAIRAEMNIELGRYNDAIIDAKAILAWIEKEGEDYNDLRIQAVSALALAHTWLGQKSEAQNYRASLDKIGTGLIPVGNDLVTSKSLSLAKVSMALGDWRGAYDALKADKTFALNAFIENLVSGAYLRGLDNWKWRALPRAYMLHKAAFELGLTDEARSGLDKLLATAETADNGEIYWLILFDRGRLAEIDKQPEAAFDFYARAITVFEQQRASINTEANKIGFVGDKQAVYAHIITVANQLGRTEAAFDYAERAKSRSLVDLLATKSTFGTRAKAAGKPISEFMKGLEQAELAAQVQSSADPSRSGSRSLAIRLKQELRDTHPDAAALVTVSAMPIKEIQSLLDPNEVAIEYFAGNGKLFAFVLDQAGLRVHTLEAGGLDARIAALRNAIETRSDAAFGEARALYDQLIKPLEADIGARPLLIIPHAGLHYLPFGALHSGSQHLIERQALRVLPNASLLALMKRGSSGPLTDGQQVLLFGNPDLGDRSLALPNAEKEVQLIAASLPGAKVYIGAEATKAAFTSEAQKYRYLHIASHGKFNPDKPLGSALYFAKGAALDGRVTVDDLYNLELDADLVTLSACETGLSKVRQGDELIGLMRGFVYAGARTVVSSLWEVDDAATAELMTQFYAAFRTHDKREALRQAQLATMKKYPHPFFWASFYLMGDAGARPAPAGVPSAAIPAVTGSNKLPG
ncbi:CHAT domain-containing protein [Chitinimonas sp. BJYL2]|uniref:CHAT domain-containing protein n=1 Tax=Chitinimonas sp. BJYL2 TaxID=2976696 RepID=UPI0022B33D14|nr:CHAT domain-containing protein [Chitinimonas sp. BJYL2]